jgi:hypothetical protein
MSDKNLELQINIKFLVKIGKTANEMLALLTLAYGQYTMKKSSVLNGIGSSRKARRCERGPKTMHMCFFQS